MNHWIIAPVVLPAFLGPLIGSVVRMLWGPLCDRFGGAIWTFVSAIGMAATMAWCGYLVAAADDPADFTIFMVALLAMFFFAGVGNASTFKQMPMIMPKRQAGGAGEAEGTEVTHCGPHGLRVGAGERRKVKGTSSRWFQDASLCWAPGKTRLRKSPAP